MKLHGVATDKKKERWMGDLLSAYEKGYVNGEWRTTELDEGRSLLYEKMIVIIGGKKKLIQSEDWNDLIQDLFIKCDERVRKSVEGGYGEGQVYRYLQSRVKGYIVNFYTKKWRENSYVMHCSSIVVSDDSDVPSSYFAKMIAGLFVQFLFDECTDLQRRVIMSSMSEEEFSIKEISDYMHYKDAKIYRILATIKRNFKQYLRRKKIIDESIC